MTKKKSRASKHPSDIDHVQAVTYTVGGVVGLMDKGGILTNVAFQAPPRKAGAPESDRDSVVTITIVGDANAAGRTYSLYNLGIQGRLWNVELLGVVAGTDVQVFGAKKAGDLRKVPVLKPGEGSSVLIRRTGTRGGDAHAPAKASGVWFVRFTGQVCVLKLRSCRRCPSGGMTKDTHDTFPDEPYSGGVF